MIGFLVVIASVFPVSPEEGAGEEEGEGLERTVLMLFILYNLRSIL